MHIHNAWLMHTTSLDILLPEIFFESPDHLFLFCGDHGIRDLCTNGDIRNFDFVNLLVSASYLLIKEDFLLSLLVDLGVEHYSESPSIIRMLYGFFKLEVHFPKVLIWLISLFPYYDTELVALHAQGSFQDFKKKIKMMKRHNERFHQHFYNRFLGRGLCAYSCKLCEKQNCAHFSQAEAVLDEFKAGYPVPSTSTGSRTFASIRADTKSETDDDSQDEEEVTTSHQCSFKCGNSIFTKYMHDNINLVDFTNVERYYYYMCLTPDAKVEYQRVHNAHNIIMRKAHIMLLKRYDGILTTRLVDYILDNLNPTQLKLVLVKDIPFRRFPPNFDSFLLRRDFNYYFPNPREIDEDRFPNSFGSFYRYLD